MNKNAISVLYGSLQPYLSALVEAALKVIERVCGAHRASQRAPAVAWRA